MRHVQILLLCCSILIISATGCSGIKRPDSYVVQETEDESGIESVPSTRVVIDDLVLQIPYLWTIQDNSMFLDEVPVLTVEVNTFDESKLKREFQYKSTEACIKSLLPNGVYLQKDNAEIREINGFSVYEFSCTADVYSKSEDMFVESKDIVYLDYLIQPDENKIYCMYFMHDMAEQNKIKEFLKNVQKAVVSSDSDGQYRWMIAD